jgi:hypothetical protein
MDQWFQKAIYITSGDGSGPLTNFCITGNSFSALSGAHNTPPFTTGGNVIEINGPTAAWAQNIAITGNQFQYAEDQSGDAIHLVNCTQFNISGNQFFEVGGYSGHAIYIDSTCSLIAWDPNQLFDNPNGAPVVDNQAYRAGSIVGRGVQLTLGTNQVFTDTVEQGVNYTSTNYMDVPSQWSSGTPYAINVPPAASIRRVSLIGTFRWDGNTSGIRHIKIKDSNGKIWAEDMRAACVNPTTGVGTGQNIMTPSIDVIANGITWFEISAYQNSGGNASLIANHCTFTMLYDSI